MIEVDFEVDRVAPWVFERVHGLFAPVGLAVIGLWAEDEIQAGAVFEGYTTNNIFCHIAIKNPAITRTLFKLIARYAFGQLNLSRLTLTADSSNIRAVRLHERLGAVVEGKLLGAGRNGDDILISRLTSECKLWRRWNGKEKRSSGGSELRAADSAAGSLEPAAVRSDVDRVSGQQQHPVWLPDLGTNTWH